MKPNIAWIDMLERISQLSDKEIEDLVEGDQCPYEPEHLIEEPVGMFHCPLCGEMILAGCRHPRQKDLEEALRGLSEED